MMTLVLKLMKSKFAAAGAVLIIAILIILMGPRFYLRSPYNFIVAGVLLVGWLIWLLIQKMRAKKNADALEGFLNQQADDQLLTARPDVKDEIAALKEKMEAAIKMLKKSKLGKGRRGANALYVLPWYMIIGPSACGKSTAIRNSGLSFPAIDPDSDSPGAIKGLGGTRNCDWWFTNEGIVLDTAGRYTVSVDAAEDREEWTAFLGLLKKFRKKSPINGLLLMVSIDELLQQTEDGLEAHAKNIRQRVDELMVKLEIVFPVYLIFTKCDLLSGFVEFFGDYAKREREQVWGYTCKYGVERSTPAHKEFRDETKKLFDALKARRMRKLRSDLRPGDEKKVYLFPLEFEAARRKLDQFMENLFEPNPFQQNPALRGVYFTSGTQEGTPIGQVMESMVKEFAIEEDIAAMLETPKEPKAYFIKDLFTQIIMGDEAATRPTAASAQRMKWLRLAAAGGIAIATVLLVLAMVASYFGNRSLIDDTLKAVQRLEDVQGKGRATLIDDLDVIDRVRDRLGVLDEYEKNGIPISLRWGLYKGNQINEVARRALRDRLVTLLLRPTAKKFEQYLRVTSLEDADSVNERFFDIGTAYMMMTELPDSAPSDLEALVEQANYVWSPDSTADELWAEDFDRLASPQIRYWWQHHVALKESTTVLEKNRELSRRVNEEIANNWSIARYFHKLIREASGNVPDFRVDAAVPGTTLLDGRPLKGAFTKVGWDEQVSGLIEQSQAEIEADPFLKKALTDIKVDIREELFKMYVQAYRRAWQEFFDNLVVASFRDISEGLDGLAELAGSDSPIIKLLDAVADNAKISKDGEVNEDIAREFLGITDFLGRSKVVDELTGGGTSESIEKYRQYIDNVASDLGDAEGALLENAKCGKTYGTLQRKIEAQRKKAVRLIVGSRSPLSSKASELLGRPFQAAKSAAYSNACDCLNEAWDAQVRSVFEGDLGGTYPFNAYGPDAPLSAIVDFFGGSSSGIGLFEQGEAKPARDAGIALSGGYSDALAVARRIRGVVAGSGLNLSFTLTARAPQFVNVQEATFTLGSKSSRYVMGGQRDYDYTWPAKDCSIAIIPLQGSQAVPLSERGDWALFRILDKARFNGNVITWTFSGSGDAVSKAGYELSGPGARFLSTGHFAAFKCPVKICGQ